MSKASRENGVGVSHSQVITEFWAFAERQPKLDLVHFYANIKWLLMQAAHVYFMYAYVFVTL